MFVVCCSCCFSVDTLLGGSRNAEHERSSWLAYVGHFYTPIILSGQQEFPSLSHALLLPRVSILLSSTCHCPFLFVTVLQVIRMWKYFVESKELYKHRIGYTQMGTSLVKVAFPRNVLHYGIDHGQWILIAIHSFIQEDCLPTLSLFTLHSSYHSKKEHS